MSELENMQQELENMRSDIKRAQKVAQDTVNDSQRVQQNLEDTVQKLIGAIIKTNPNEATMLDIMSTINHELLTVRHDVQGTIERQQRDIDKLTRTVKDALSITSSALRKYDNMLAWWEANYAVKEPDMPEFDEQEAEDIAKAVPESFGRPCNLEAVDLGDYMHKATNEILANEDRKIMDELPKAITFKGHTFDFSNRDQAIGFCVLFTNQFRHVLHIRRYGRTHEVTDIEFIVNRDARTVVCMVRGFAYSGVSVKRERKAPVVARGVAKCDPADTFNEHIGRAIAIGRAFKADVSWAKYIVSTRDPSEVAWGDIVGITDLPDRRGEGLPPYFVHNVQIEHQPTGAILDDSRSFESMKWLSDKCGETLSENEYEYYMGERKREDVYPMEATIEPSEVDDDEDNASEVAPSVLTTIHEKRIEFISRLAHEPKFVYLSWDMEQRLVDEIRDTPGLTFEFEYARDTLPRVKKIMGMTVRIRKPEFTGIVEVG